jgi:peptidoglycan hydrolase-like protein with peptidoglycan-binding domain
MKKLFMIFLASGFFLTCACADETVKAAQTKLREDGFYSGDVTGNYDGETAAAVTRYQIRRGLEISGKLDPATAQALGVSGTTPPATELSHVSGTWKRLRNGDMQFRKQLNAGEVAPAKAPLHSSPPPAAKASSKAPPEPPSGAFRESDEVYGKERLRDYVGAFILAGLDPQIGAE